MSLFSRIEQDYLVAYKARDSVRLAVLRHIKTACKNAVVDKRRELSEEELVDLILKQAKQRQDSIAQFTAGNRPDLADKEQAELTVIREYLPKFLEGDELAAVVKNAVAKVKAAGPQDLGKVIGAVMAEYKGKVDGKAVRELAKAALAGK